MPIMLKAFNVTVGILVAFSVWCAAIMMAALALHVMVIGGLTAYYLMHH